jgi:hypothetical protein
VQLYCVYVCTTVLLSLVRLLSRQMLVKEFNLMRTRVTRLGEFSPIERLCTMGRFSRIAEVAKKFGLLFSTVIDMYYF